MSVKQILGDNFSQLKDEREINLFLNDVITFLHNINEQYSSSLLESGIFSKDRLSARSVSVDRDLKQAVETIKENIKLISLAKSTDEIAKICAERDNLKNAISRAQSLIDEAKADVSKAKRATHSELKRKLQITRDRLVSTASTSNTLAAELNSNADRQTMEDTLNNILMGINVITDELTALELWGEDEEKPNVTPIKLDEVTTTHKKGNARRKTSSPKEDTNDDAAQINL